MLSSYGRLGNEDLEAFQKTHHLELPADYKEYLLENNGGSAGTQMICFQAKGIEEPVALGALFGLNQSVKNASIETWLEECRHDLLDNMVVIGKTVFPGLILLSNRKKGKGVYFWDYSCLYETSGQFDCIYFLASTFDAFYRGLFIPKEPQGFVIDLEYVIQQGCVPRDDSTLHYDGISKKLQVVDAVIHHEFTQFGEIPNPKKYKYYRVAFRDTYGPLLRRKRGRPVKKIKVIVRDKPRG